MDSDFKKKIKIEKVGLMSKFFVFFLFGSKKEGGLFLFEEKQGCGSSLVLCLVFLAPSDYFNVRSPSAIKKLAKK